MIHYAIDFLIVAFVLHEHYWVRRTFLEDTRALEQIALLCRRITETMMAMHKKYRDPDDGWEQNQGG